jgi:hypothetical protein
MLATSEIPNIDTCNFLYYSREPCQSWELTRLASGGFVLRGRRLSRALVGTAILAASLFVAVQPAQAVSIKCANDNTWRICIGTLVDSSGTVIAYTSTACNITTKGVGVKTHLTLTESPKHWDGVSDDKVLYGVTDSSKACFTIQVSSSRDSSTKTGTASVSGTGVISVGVQDKLS